MAENYNTTPWDVRKNATMWDIERTSALSTAKNRAQTMRDKMKGMKDKMANKIQSGRQASRGKRR